jgi:hypothetical protein
MAGLPVSFVWYSGVLKGQGSLIGIGNQPSMMKDSLRTPAILKKQIG